MTKPGRHRPSSYQNNFLLAVFLLALVLAPFFYAADAPPPETTEREQSLLALNSELSRMEILLPDVSDESYKSYISSVLAALKAETKTQHEQFDQARSNELKLKFLVEHQRLRAWLQPLKIPPASETHPTVQPPAVSRPSDQTISRVPNSVALPNTASVATPPSARQAFLETHCTSCHDSTEQKGNLDLESLAFDTENPNNFSTWVKVHDRVASGKMPPKKKRRPDPSELEAFIGGLGAHLKTAESARIAHSGRSTQRRLNAYEYENAIRDLLHVPWMQIKNSLPDDGVSHHFNKSGKSLDISHVQVARFLNIADSALRQAISVQASRPPTTTKRYYAREQKTLSNEYKQQQLNTWPDRQNFPLLGTTTEVDVRKGLAALTAGEKDPVKRELEAVGWVAKAFPKWNRTPLPVAGRYKLRFSGYTIWVGPNGYSGYFKKEEEAERIAKARRWHWADIDTVLPGRRNEPISIYAESAGQNRRVGGFDLTPEPTVHEMETWLASGENIVPAAIGLYYPRPPSPTNPNAQRDGAPGVAFRWLEIEGPLYDEATTSGYRLLFGQLPLKAYESDGKKIIVESPHPKEDAGRLLRGFVKKAFHRPPQEADVADLLALVHAQLDAGTPFAEAMIAGYTAALTSPGFLVLQDDPGLLDDYGIAGRLSLFLWNSPPDDALRDLAAKGELHHPDVLRRETERLLDDPRSTRFVEAFLDYWLDLRKMEDTSPSITLYNDYYLDDSLTEAALAEPRLFFSELLRQDLPARHLVSSDFTFLNERLARHYGIDGVSGVAMRHVTLPAGSPRGGFLTQAGVLKVTANGTTTSPVLRGKWITERILGHEIPPPPPVAAVEPDIRGAVTIRQQLEKHRTDTSCASCHSKIDPPGFALENFDIFGGWRDQYRAIAAGKPTVDGFGKNGLPYEYHLGLPVDAAGEFPDGRAFKDVRDFKRLLLEDETQIARNLVQQLVIFATGSPVGFSERDEVEALLQGTRTSGYGVRQIIHALVQSDLFRKK